jgi:hypothetical protein
MASFKNRKSVTENQRVVSLSGPYASSRNRSFSFAGGKAKFSPVFHAFYVGVVQVIFVVPTTLRRGAGKFYFSVLQLRVIWRFYSTCIKKFLGIVSLA